MPPEPNQMHPRAIRSTARLLRTQTTSGPGPRTEPAGLSAQEDALPAITLMAGWVNNADTKTGILTGGLLLLGAAYLRQQNSVEKLLAHAEGRGFAALAVFAFGAICLALGAAHAYLALRPRVQPGEPSRFSFPHLAQLEIRELMTQDGDQVRSEAWTQAQTMARIVAAKYRHFQLTLAFATLSTLMYVAWLLLLPS
jgi:hypothetical protein